VILDPERPVEGLNDSKLLPEEVREELALLIKDRARCWAIASASVEEIERMNILRASLFAMRRAILALSCRPLEVCVDGLHKPPVRIKCRPVVKADRTVPEVSAASILAKTARDAEMREMDTRFPGYGFANHKGYSTPEHLSALKALAPARSTAAPSSRCACCCKSTSRSDMKAVSSRDNAAFKAMAKLARSTSERKRRGLTVLDGAHLVAAFLDSGREVDSLHGVRARAAAPGDRAARGSRAGLARDGRDRGPLPRALDGRFGHGVIAAARDPPRGTPFRPTRTSCWCLKASRTRATWARCCAAPPRRERATPCSRRTAPSRGR
jgi:ribonuclease HII